METQERKPKSTGKCCTGKNDAGSSRKWMSVKEMGDLLGIRKTDRYWLVHKNFFATKTMYGKMWVNIASFEKWYANQTTYKKITGEAPGAELMEWSLSPRDIMHLLDIPEYRVYDLIKEKGWEIVTVDYRMRITKESFFRWYQSQKHYRTLEDRLRDQELEEKTITFPAAAAMIGLTRNQFYPILKNPRYAHFFEIVEIAGRRRITKESFQRFLNGQPDYGLVSVHDQKSPDKTKHDDGSKEDSPSNQQNDIRSNYLTVAEAASLANISRQAITKYVDQGCFGKVRKKNLIRIRRTIFDAWLEKRTREVTGNGID